MCVLVCKQRPEDGIRDLPITLYPIPLRLSLTEPETRLAARKPQGSLIPTVLELWVSRVTPGILHEY